MTIYLDSAATTQCSAGAIEAAVRAMRENYYNPSALYHEGLMLKEQLNGVRSMILGALRAEGSVVFTGGGTESDNLALFGCKKPKQGDIVVSAGEHAAVYAAATELKQRGYDVRFCPVKGDGSTDFEAFCQMITEKTALASVMHVNNETGAVNDLGKFSAALKAKNPRALFHSDGVQAFGKLKLNLQRDGIDLYAISAHKIHAPKGVGALFIRKGIHLSPVVYGGGQEGGLRSSTENVPGILAFGAAITETIEKQGETAQNLSFLRRKVIVGLTEGNDEIRLISPENGSPYIVTFTMAKVRGEVMQHALERKGILIGTGSACSSNKAGKRIPDALGLSGKWADGVVRISFCRNTTEAEIDRFLVEFKQIYGELSRYGS